MKENDGQRLLHHDVTLPYAFIARTVNTDAQIIEAYEALLLHEKQYLHKKVSAVHKTLHALTSVYSAPLVEVSTPNGSVREWVKGEASLVALIRRLFAHGDAHGKIPTELIVQRVPVARATGIVMTRDVYTGEKDKALIHACLGGAYIEAMSDVYVVNKTKLTIAAKHQVDQAYKEILSGKKYRKVPLGPTTGVIQKLTDDEILQVAQLAKDVERALYFPQKVTYCFEKKELFVLEVKRL